MYKISGIASKLYELLKTSTLTQIYITIVLITVAAVMWYTARPIPEGLKTLLYIVIGFYFGRKYNDLPKKEG